MQKPSDKKTILVDASNLLDGGGLSHLREFVRTFSSLSYPNLSLVVIGNSKALSSVSSSPNIHKINHPYLEKSIFFRTYFRKFLLHKVIQNFDIIFDPGGGYYSSSVRYVTMSRNMLVFEKNEADRYGFSWMRLRLWLLNKLQTKSINGANGVIFISKYAKNYISNLHNIHIKSSTIIHHGATQAFVCAPRKQKEITDFSLEKPFKLLYVSIVDVYKHHQNLVKAVAILRQKYPIDLTLVGGHYAPSMALLQETLSSIKNSSEFIHYVGKKNWSELSNLYKSADMFVFPSSCENMPNILIEAMSSGLPIACSDKGPMPEFLQDAGIYFNPEDSNDIANAIEKMLLNTSFRAHCATKAFNYAQTYSWEKCAKETIDFILSTISQDNKK